MPLQFLAINENLINFEHCKLVFIVSMRFFNMLNDIRPRLMLISDMDNCNFNYIL